MDNKKPIPNNELDAAAPQLAEKRNRKYALLAKSGNDSPPLSLAKVVANRLLDQYGIGKKSDPAYEYVMDLRDLELCAEDSEVLKAAKAACKQHIEEHGMKGSRAEIAAVRTLSKTHLAADSKELDPALIKHFDDLGLSEPVKRTAIVLFDLKLNPLALGMVTKNDILLILEGYRLRFHNKLDPRTIRDHVQIYRAALVVSLKSAAGTAS
jgi:hypothetical protein